jgi:hypothetical protein
MRIAVALTVLALLTLVGLKVATGAGWRAGFASSLRACVEQQSSAGTTDSIPEAGQLAACVTRRQPLRHDPIEVVTVAGLTIAAAAEIAYLARHR